MSSGNLLRLRNEQAGAYFLYEKNAARDVTRKEIQNEFALEGERERCHTKVQITSLRAQAK